jgi:hypothetical protein
MTQRAGRPDTQIQELNHFNFLARAEAEIGQPVEILKLAAPARGKLGAMNWDSVDDFTAGAFKDTLWIAGLIGLNVLHQGSITSQ